MGQTFVSRPMFHLMASQLCESSGCCTAEGPGHHPTPSLVCVPGRPGIHWKWQLKRKTSNHWSLGSSGLWGARAPEPGRGCRAVKPRPLWSRAPTCNLPSNVRPGTIVCCSLLPFPLVISGMRNSILGRPNPTGIRVTLGGCNFVTSLYSLY